MGYVLAFLGYWLSRIVGILKSHTEIIEKLNVYNMFTLEEGQGDLLCDENLLAIVKNEMCAV